MRELHKERPTAGTQQLEQYLFFKWVVFIHGWLRLSARIAAPPSPKSLTPTSSARFGALAAAPHSCVVNMVNKQQESAEVHGEDDSRGPPRQRMEK